MWKYKTSIHGHIFYSYKPVLSGPSWHQLWRIGLTSNRSKVTHWDIGLAFSPSPASIPIKTDSIHRRIEGYLTNKNKKTVVLATAQATCTAVGLQKNSSTTSKENQYVCRYSWEWEFLIGTRRFCGFKCHRHCLILPRFILRIWTHIQNK